MYVHYRNAINQHNNLYFSNKKIDLVPEYRKNAFINDFSETVDMSTNFSHMKIYREEIDKINQLKTRITNPAMDFIQLLSYAVCDNVDTYGICKHLKYAHCYISLTDLFKIFKTRSVSVINNKLNALKYGFHAIDFEIKEMKNDYKRYYFYFTCCNDQIIRGGYYDKNPNYYDIKGCAFAAKTRQGFFLVNKYIFQNTFFNDEDVCKHGIKDLYLLLRLNTSYNDLELPKSLRHGHHLVTWGAFSNQMCNTNIYFITINALSKILNNSYKNIYHYLEVLKKENLIDKFFIRNKGQVIINKYLDKKENIISNKTCFLFSVKNEILKFSINIKQNLIFFKLNINEHKKRIGDIIAYFPFHTPNFEFVQNNKTYDCLLN